MFLQVQTVAILLILLYVFACFELLLPLLRRISSRIQLRENWTGMKEEFIVEKPEENVKKYYKKRTNDRASTGTAGHSRGVKDMSVDGPYDDDD